MNRQELLIDILSQDHTRIEYLRSDFYTFFLYYFSKHIKYGKMAAFQKDWCIKAQQGLNLYVEGQRDSAKTTILGMAFEIWKICYNKADFICNLCYDKDKAKAFNKLIAQELINNKQIKADYGVLYSKKASDYHEDDLADKGISEFVTTNYIKVKAFGMGEAIRGEVFNSKIKGNVRPDHLFCDDIDNDKNTKNLKFVKADMEFLNGEVIGGLDKNKGQIIWIGNIIRKDGRNPRKRDEVKNNKSWKVFSNFIYGEAGNKSGNIQWERYVETDKEAEEINKNNIHIDSHVISLDFIRREEGSSFDQNRLGIPRVKGQSVVKEEWIRYTQEKIKFDYIQIGIDPAFSLKTGSDAIGIVVVGFKKIGNIVYKYNIFCKKLEGADKDEDIAEKIVRSLYDKYGAVRVIVEKNNGGELFGRLLAKKGMHVEIVASSKDKLTRFREHEGEMMRGEIFFYPECEDLVNEFLGFTGDDGGEDNQVDAAVHGWTEYDKKEFYFL
ncbi:MAG: hypothetical protein PHN31_01850 [Candidatus Gracilibacteria bacterium]|nr:hypothetical protein [Candidatus Gracilibacteria bacterium]